MQSMNTTLHINYEKLIRFGGFIREEAEKNLLNDKRDAMRCKYNRDISEIEKYIPIFDPDFAAVAAVVDDYDYLACSNTLYTLNLRKYMNERFYDWVVEETAKLVKQKKSSKNGGLKKGNVQVDNIEAKLNILDEHILTLVCTMYEDRIATHEDIAHLPEYKGKDIYIQIIMIRIDEILEEFDMSYDEIKKYIEPIKNNKKGNKKKK